MQLLDAGVRKIAKRGNHEHEQQRRRHAEQAKARLAARNKALIGGKPKHRRARTHEKNLQHK